MLNICDGVNSFFPSFCVSLLCSYGLCDLTWTASVGRCSTLFQKREASWRLSVSCDQSWPQLCSVEASSASLAPLAKDRWDHFQSSNSFSLILHKSTISASLRLEKIKMTGIINILILERHDFKNLNVFMWFHIWHRCNLSSKDKKSLKQQNIRWVINNKNLLVIISDVTASSNTWFVRSHGNEKQGRNKLLCWQVDLNKYSYSVWGTLGAMGQSLDVLKPQRSPPKDRPGAKVGQHLQQSGHWSLFKHIQQVNWAPNYWRHWVSFNFWLYYFVVWKAN